MSCDIHLFTEVRDPDGVWRTADTWTPYDDGDGDVGMSVSSFYDGRSYDTFAILADVRNGRGFAGCDTGDGFNPIADPRGLPEDICPEVAAESERWGCDGHSHSWLTLAELLAYNWTQRTKRRGWVDPLGWAMWRSHGAPRSRSGEVFGGRVTHHSNEEMERAWQVVRARHGWPVERWPSAHMREEGVLAEFAAALPTSGNPYTQAEWEVAYHEAAAAFWSSTMPQLLHLGAPDDVRIVFFFDN